MKSVAEVVAELMQRPPEEREEIGLALLNSVEGDPDDEEDGPAAVEAAWNDELRRRMDEIDRGEVEMVTMEQLEKDIREWRAARAAGKAR